MAENKVAYSKSDGYGKIIIETSETGVFIVLDNWDHIAPIAMDFNGCEELDEFMRALATARNAVFEKENDNDNEQ